MRHLLSVVRIFGLMFVFGLALFCAGTDVLAASEWHVSPSGSASGDGSAAKPWDIKTALDHPSAVKPGDTIWLHGGVYGTGGSTSFSADLTGTSDAPIKVRQYPSERAVVNGGIDSRGQHVWWWGFEITNSSTDRTTTESNRPIGLKLWAPNQKSINVSVHNTGRTATSFHYRGEQYGGIFFGNGFYDTSQSNKIRGGSVYANLAEDTPAETNLVANTIAFRNWNSGIKIYSEWSDRYVNGFRVEGNTQFDAGTQNMNIHSRTNPVEDLVVENNYTYHRSDDNSGNFDLGYSSKPAKNAVVRNNYFVSGTHGYGNSLVYNWQNIEFTNNILVTTYRSIMSHIPHTSPEIIKWDNNKYYFAGSSSYEPFKHKSSTYTFSEWKSLTGYDVNSTYTNAYPSGSEATKVYYVKNKYFDGVDTLRGNITVYNWDKKASVTADLSQLDLAEGEEYAVYDAQYYINSADLSAANHPAVKTGTFTSTNKTVDLPMNLTKVSAIPGEAEIDHFENKHTAPEFAAFIVLKTKDGSGTGSDPGDGGSDPEPTPTPEPKKGSMTIAKSVDKADAVSGDTLTYTLSYTNDGEGAATNVKVEDVIPANTSYVVGSATNNGALVGSSLTWNLGTVAAGAEGTLTFQVTAN